MVPTVTLPSNAPPRTDSEDFNSELRDELLAGEQFSTLQRREVLIEHHKPSHSARSDLSLRAARAARQPGA